MKFKKITTDKHTIASGLLDVGNGHKIYYEHWGNPKGVPVILFHGGPGSSYKPNHKYSFDPERFQVIGFDQRGCGNSQPYGKLEHNTTQDTMSDAVKLLEELGIKTTYVFGGSWGATLATLFTIKHGDRVKGTIATNVFLASPDEADWMMKGHFQSFYPEVWERFLAATPKSAHDNPAAYHYNVLAGDDTAGIITSAKALEELEGPLSRFDWRGYKDIQPDKAPDDKPAAYDYVPYRIFAHYLSNDCFLPDKYILNHAAAIKTPFYIVQGRYDMSCPPITAYHLHQAITGSKLYMTLASHDNDPENRTARKTLVDNVFV